MNPPKLDSEPPPILGENDPPADFSREEAAYQRERDRLVRDHWGKIILVVGDEVIGVFETASAAILEGYRRFGDVKMMIKPIGELDEPIFMPLVDINHPSVKRID